MNISNIFIYLGKERKKKAFPKLSPWTNISFPAPKVDARKNIALHPSAAIVLNLRFLKMRPTDQIDVNAPIIANAIPKGGINKCRNVAATAVTTPIRNEKRCFI